MLLRLENAELFIRRTCQEVQHAILQHSEFLSALKDDSDWAFVIKTHAFLEAILTSLIRSHSGDFKRGDIASRLQMNSSDGISKLGLIKANQLLSHEQMRFIRRLGEIRNLLAHEVGLVDTFAFRVYVSRLDGNQMKNWRRDMTYFMLEDPTRYPSDVSVSDPRLAITEALLDLIRQIEGSRVQVDMKSEIQEVVEEDTMQLIDSLVEKQGNEVETRTHFIKLGENS